MVVGGALAVSGAVYPGLFRNPLSDSGYPRGIVGPRSAPSSGFIFPSASSAYKYWRSPLGSGAVAAVYLVGIFLLLRRPLLALVLLGVLLGTLRSSVVGLIKYLADPYNQLPAITFWLLGSLTGITAVDLWAILPAICFGLAPLYLLRWRMNVMTLGDEEAQALGVDTQRVRMVVVKAATLMTAAAVSVSGIIGWIGLLIPHFARLLVGPDFGRLLPASIL
jgi:iron complex transport system permease protein